jgi:flagellar biosynthesis/type III secretory pathway protein FliH
MQKNDAIRKAAELCERAAFTPEELLEYEASKEHIRIERAVREGTRRDAIAEGKAIGLEEGKAMGLEEGLEKGETIGLEKGEAKRIEQQENMVVNSRKEGLSVDTISKIFGLIPEQVIEILKRHGIE